LAELTCFVRLVSSMPLNFLLQLLDAFLGAISWDSEAE
jgi:hypothetical protein